MAEALERIEDARLQRHQRDEQQVGEGDARELDRQTERLGIVAQAGRQCGHDVGHEDDHQRRERQQDRNQRRLRLARELQRRRPAAIVQRAGEQRHEGLVEGALGEQAAEEVGQLERDEEGVGHRPGAGDGGDHHVAGEAGDAAQQGEAADRGDGAGEAH